jgi:hypothetical protein
VAHCRRADLHGSSDVPLGDCNNCDERKMMIDDAAAGA